MSKLKSNPSKFQLKQIVKDFAQLPKLQQLLKENEMQTATPIATPTPHIFHTFSSEMDIVDCIHHVLMDSKQQLTIAEICNLMHGSQYSPEAITQHVIYMMNSGMLNKSSVGHGKFAYSLKPSAPCVASKKSSIHFINHAENKVVSENEAAMNEPITLHDGMNRAIWKIMCDRKTRTCHEIAKLLFVFGFDQSLVKDRVTGLAKKSWFDRRNADKGVGYSLKKIINVPAKEVPIEAVVHGKITTLTAKPPANIAKPTSGIMTDVKALLATQSIEKNVKAKNTTKPATKEWDSHVQRIMSQPVYPAGELPLKVRSTPVALSAPVVQQYPILSEDSLKMRVWKVMQDGSELTIPEIALLVCENDYTVSSVRSLVQAMTNEVTKTTIANYGGQIWFTRTLNPKLDVRKGDKYVYKLIPGIPMPVNKVGRKVNVDVPVVAKSDLVSPQETNATLAFIDGPAIANEGTKEMKDQPATHYLYENGKLTDDDSSLVPAKPVYATKLELATAFLKDFLSNGPALQTTVVEASEKQGVEYDYLELAGKELKLHWQKLTGFKNQTVNAVSLTPFILEQTEVEYYIYPTAGAPQKSNVTLDEVLTVVADPKAPLISIDVKIKDASFTFEEAEELLGKGKVSNTSHSSLVKLNGAIKGIQCTTAEFEEIAAFLIQKGFGKSMLAKK